jgi:hypothetical protein
LIYLAKAEQQLQIRCEGNVHTFGTSDVPKKVKAGRPHNDSALGVENDSIGQTPGVQQDDALVQRGSVSTGNGTASRLCKSGVPLPLSD